MVNSLGFYAGGHRVIICRDQLNQNFKPTIPCHVAPYDRDTLDAMSTNDRYYSTTLSLMHATCHQRATMSAPYKSHGTLVVVPRGIFLAILHKINVFPKLHNVISLSYRFHLRFCSYHWVRLNEIFATTPFFIRFHEFEFFLLRSS